MAFPCANENRAQQGTQLLWPVTGLYSKLQVPREIALIKLALRKVAIYSHGEPGSCKELGSHQVQNTPTATEDKRTTIQFNTGAALRTIDLSQFLHLNKR